MTGLPIVDDCHGCGVCCLQMGFPTFMLPAKPLTEVEIDADPELRQRAKDPDIRQHLLDGHPGESFWHNLPQHLRLELEEFWEVHAGKTDSLNGPCIWLDQVTRQCKHHEYRPLVCRDFDVGSIECQEWREHYRDRIKP
jgi:Fe-S-cluster containining protein